MNMSIRTILGAAAIAIMLLFVQVAIAGQQSALHFHKAKYFMDQNGQTWLSVQFVNDGSAAIKVAAIAPDRSGPWTKIDQKVEPAAKVKGALKIVKDTPSKVWVDSSLGLLEFDIAPRK